MIIKLKRKSDYSKVDALRFHGNFEEVERFVGGDCEWRGDGWVVAGPEGALQGKNGDWIISEGHGYQVIEHKRVLEEFWVAQ